MPQLLFAESSHPPPAEPDQGLRAVRSLVGRRWPMALAALVLSCGAAASVWAWLSAAQAQAQVADNEFEQFTELTVNNVTQRLQHQIDLLGSFQALFRGGTDVSRSDFHRLFSDLRVQARFAGMRAIQYSRRVSEAQRPALEASVRADRSLDPLGYPRFAVHPGGLRPDYMVVLYNEPMHGNEMAMGYDSAAEASRREVVERARDTGSPAASPPLTLLQGRAGVVVRVPVYRVGSGLDSVAARRDAHVGQVSGIFLADDLLRGALPQQRADLPYRIRITDTGPIDTQRGDTQPGAPISADAVLAQAGAALPEAGLTKAWFSADGAAANNQRSYYLPAAGRSWRIDVARAPVQQALTRTPLMLLSTGLAATLVLAGVVARLAWLNQRAHGMAARLSAQARANAKRLDAVFNSTLDGIITTDLHGTMLSVNRAAQQLFGYDAAQLIGQDILLLAPDGAKAQCRGRSGDSLVGRTQQTQGKRADGSLFAIEFRVSAMQVDGQRQYVGLVRDLTAIRAAEQCAADAAQALQAADRLREAVFQHAAFALIVTDPQRLIRAINPAGERLLGWPADQLVGRRRMDEFHDPAEFAALGQAIVNTLRPEKPMLASQDVALERQIHMLRSDGQRVPVSLTLSALRDAEGQFEGLIGICYDITERQRLSEQLSRMAFHDALTGLVNRVRLEERLGQAMASACQSGAPLALLFIDLDRFKPINDTHGHAVGDQVLCEVARRLLAQVRGTDTVARVGGDEFVVLLTHLGQVQDCLLVADKLVEAISQPMLMDGRWLQVGASVGVAQCPQTGADPAALLRQADAAMYRAKLTRRQALAALVTPVLPVLQ